MEFDEFVHRMMDTDGVKERQRKLEHKFTELGFWDPKKEAKEIVLDSVATVSHLKDGEFIFKVEDIDEIVDSFINEVTGRGSLAELKKEWGM